MDKQPPSKLLFAQDVLRPGYETSVGCGFNSRVLGDTYIKCVDGAWDRGPRGVGWDKAEELIQVGRIYFVHPFPHSDSQRCHAFPFGGTWVCNGCLNSRLDKPWWRIRVFKDGNAWCCVGEGFVDLQESDNYAYGDTRDAAIEAYGTLMSAVPA